MLNDEVNDPVAMGQENKDVREDFYLWHLVRLGVLEKVEDTDSIDGNRRYRSPLWDEAAKTCDNEAGKVTVAIIDSGIDTDHPNLASDCRVLPQIDFTPHLYGAFYDFPFKASLGVGLTAEQSTRTGEEEIENWVKRLGLDKSQWEGRRPRKPELGTSGFPKEEISPGPIQNGQMLDNQLPDFSALEQMIYQLVDPFNDEVSDALKSELLKLWKNAQEGQSIKIPTEDPSRYFGAHGTACAGLIGGGKIQNVENEKSTAFYRKGLPSAIDYFGVNPYCKILPICTPYSHEILPVINALLYAFVMGAEVIHIPRGLPDYAERSRFIQHTHSRTRIDRPRGAPDDHIQAGDQADLTRLLLHTGVFELLLKEMSKHRIIVLSAGNDGWKSRLAYPAQIHDPDQDNLIVVGAVNRDGYKADGSGKKNDWRNYISSYSNGSDSEKDMIHVLSDDGFALHKAHIAYDERGRSSTDYSYEPHIPEDKENKFSAWGLLTLDVRGSYGYAAGRRYDPPEHEPGVETGDLYTVFGGTSGASALAAGLLSLHLQLNYPNDGKIDGDLIRTLIGAAQLS